MVFLSSSLLTTLLPHSAAQIRLQLRSLLNTSPFRRFASACNTNNVEPFGRHHTFLLDRPSLRALGRAACGASARTTQPLAHSAPSRRSALLLLLAKK